MGVVTKWNSVQDMHGSSLHDAEDDVDECGDIGNIHVAIAIHIGHLLIHGCDAQYHVNEGCDISYIDFAVGIYVTGGHGVLVGNVLDRPLATEGVKLEIDIPGKRTEINGLR